MDIVNDIELLKVMRIDLSFFQAETVLALSCTTIVI